MPTSFKDEVTDSQYDKNQQKLMSILAGTYRATGLVLDDNPPRNLYQTVTTFAADTGFPIDLTYLLSAPDALVPLKSAAAADFTIVDHRLEREFCGYRDGLDLASTVRTNIERQPLFYCSAYGPDFRKRVNGGAEQFVRRASFLGTAPHTFFFDKDDLTEERRLREFTTLLYLESLNYVLGSVISSAPKEILRMLASRPVRKESAVYRDDGPVGRGWRRVRQIQGDAVGSEEVVPSRLLKCGGAGTLGDLARHEIVEFDSGIVASYFLRETNKGISRGIARMLQGDEDD